MNEVEFSFCLHDRLKKDEGCCMLEIVEAKLEGPLLIFTGTTISEDPELWNQLCRLQFLK